MKKFIVFPFILIGMMSCRDQAAEKVAQDHQYTLDSIKVAMQQQEVEMAKQKTIDSMNAVVATRETQAAVAASNRTTTNNNTTTTTTTEAKKKGWSSTAKGAVIGAGAGAITGAVVSKKKKGQGAIIGGLAGAAVGAGTGAIIDGKKKE